jgi:hypothetical protein
MTTIIAAYNGDKCLTRCNYRCYEARKKSCNCICKGKNHGVGLAQAIRNAATARLHWAKEWKDAHPETTHIEHPSLQMLLLD